MNHDLCGYSIISQMVMIIKIIKINIVKPVY